MVRETAEREGKKGGKEREKRKNHPHQYVQDGKGLVAMHSPRLEQVGEGEGHVIRCPLRGGLVRDGPPWLDFARSKHTIGHARGARRGVAIPGIVLCRYACTLYVSVVGDVWVRGDGFGPSSSFRGRRSFLGGRPAVGRAWWRKKMSLLWLTAHAPSTTPAPRPCICVP